MYSVQYSTTYGQASAIHIEPVFRTRYLSRRLLPVFVHVFCPRFLSASFDDIEPFPSGLFGTRYDTKDIMIPPGTEEYSTIQYRG
jgi:hypothetical protein